MPTSLSRTLGHPGGVLRDARYASEAFHASPPSGLEAVTSRAGNMRSRVPILGAEQCVADAEDAHPFSSICLPGNHVTASVTLTLNTVSPLWSLTFRPNTRSVYVLRTSFEIFASALTASRAAASRFGNFVPNWSQPLRSPSLKSKKY